MTWVKKTLLRSVFITRVGEWALRSGSTNMTALKALTIGTALLLGGVSLAIAQGPPTGGYPPVAGGAAGNPGVPGTEGAPGPNLRATTPSHHATRHHKKLYMTNRTHKGSKM